MKTFLRLSAILLLLFSVLFAFAACGNDPAPSGDGGKIRVMLTASDCLTVKSQNPVEVAPGEDAVFEVELANRCAITSLSAGYYENGRIVVPAVEKRTTVVCIAKNVGYDADTFYYFFMRGSTADRSTVGSGVQVRAGTEITITAADTEKIFVGWSLDGYIAKDNPAISTDRVYTFCATPDLVNGDTIGLYANYKEAGAYLYDPNGGSVNTMTPNMRASGYYSATYRDGVVRIVFSDDYRKKVNVLSTFYDDGTFTREGYVLKEYNTMPDGSGEGYSLGSKFYSEPVGEKEPVLYCIWERANPAAFNYQTASYPCPTTEARAPFWHTNGVIITSYNGNDETVAIPEKIGDQYVIGIASGAFTNKAVKTLVLSRFIEKIEDGALTGCSSLETIYYPDSIYDITDDALDGASYRNFRHLIVNATMAPRFSNTGEGAFAYKLARLLRSQKENRIITIAGSSSYQGLATGYLEALFGGAYTAINFGTTRTTQGTIYLEAMKHFAHEGDIVLYAPENSSYMLGEPELYWKTLRDLEGVINFYRYIDVSHYTGVFSAFADFNQSYRYGKDGLVYEQIINVGNINPYGEYQNAARQCYVQETKYIDAYYITLNERVKSKNEGTWSDKANQEKNKDYTDPANVTWASITDSFYASRVNSAIDAAKSSGAEVLFSFCPVDADKVVAPAQNVAWTEAYDALILKTYHFDGILGASKDYVFAHNYFYDCAFHPNDYGRTIRTYRVYMDLCRHLDLTINDYDAFGTDFEGCLFESGTLGYPKHGVSYLY